MPFETGPKTTEARALDALERLVLEDDRHTVTNALGAVHVLVGMDVTYLSELTEHHQVIHELVGHGEPFGLAEGARIPLEKTYCVRMLAGDIPTAIADTMLEPATTAHPATREAGIRAYVGVPVRLSNGRISGTLCCASATPHRLRGRHVRFMRVVARLIADQLERDAGAPGTGWTMGEAPDEHAGPGNVKINLWFAAARGSVAAARGSLEALAHELAPAALDDARLIVTELVANSVEHAGIGPAQVVGLQAAVSSAGLRVEISDPGPGFVPAVPSPPDPDSEDQWGLVLVDTLADRWGVDRDGPTKVWFELEPSRALPGHSNGAAAA